LVNQIHTLKHFKSWTCLRGQGAGFLAAVTRVRCQIEALLMNTDNTQTVQILNKRYIEAWRKFEDSHMGYISLLTPGSMAFNQVVEQFSQLSEEKITLLQRVTVYLHSYTVTHSNHVLKASTRNSVDKELGYVESVTSHR
jgi:hypothetical protein